MEKDKIGIVGSGGAVGVSLLDILSQHPELKDNYSLSPQGLSSLEGQEWEDTIGEYLGSHELVVLALPDKVAQMVVAVKKKLALTTKILDCSTAYRANEDWVYGLPELNSDQAENIAKAELVANPGCHATASILSSVPLVQEGLINPESLVSIASLTGYSGGGKAMIEQYEQNPDIAPVAYSVGKNHKHVPEMIKYGQMGKLNFQPAVVNTFKGLQTNLVVDALKSISTKDLIKLYEEYYKGQIFIKIKEVLNPNKVSMTECNDTQMVNIYPMVNENSIQVMAVLDNLGKGAAGAAVQNINLMTGLPQETGLIS